MTSKLAINLRSLLHQRQVEGERIENRNLLVFRAMVALGTTQETENVGETTQKTPVETPVETLVKTGRLQFEGPKKGGHWEIRER